MGLTISTANGLNSNQNQTLNTKDLMSQNSPDFRQGNENDGSMDMMGGTQEMNNQEELIHVRNQMEPHNEYDQKIQRQPFSVQTSVNNMSNFYRRVNEKSQTRLSSQSRDKQNRSRSRDSFS